MKYYKEKDEYARPFNGPHIYVIDHINELVRIFYYNRKQWSAWTSVHDFAHYVKYFNEADHFDEITKKETFFEVL